MILLGQLDSPIGPLSIAERGGRVCLLHFGGDGPEVRAMLARWYPSQPVQTSPGPGASRDALLAYFSGQVDALDGIPVAMNGTPFQKRVWEALRSVRAGTTATYSQIAQAVGAPAAVRAVGAANGANPVALIVPCHRIIGANGSLTGYGGGLDRKRWLLDHEAPSILPFHRENL